MLTKKQSIILQNTNFNFLSCLSWRKYIQKNNHPFYAAIDIYSEIVYWYRPKIRYNGETPIYSKRFNAKSVQLSKRYLSNKFDLSMSQVSSALKYLKENGYIYQELKKIKVKDIAFNNVAYYDLNFQKFEEITHDV